MIDKNKFFEKHAITIVAGVAILTVIIIACFSLGRSEYERKNESKDKTKSEIRFDTLTQLALKVFDSNERFEKDWILFAKLKAAEDAYYGDIDINLNTYPKELPNNSVQISTSKILIPSPKDNAIKDIYHGLPLSFSYKFIFNDQDIISNKYVVVQYDKDTAVDYDFSFSPTKNLLNRDIVNSKLTKWHNNRQRLAKEQQQQIKEDEKTQAESLKKNCQNEKELVTSTYNFLMNNLSELEYQYQNLPDQEFAIYLTNWNRDATEIRSQYHKTEMECFFFLDYNQMLASYQYAGLSFIKLYQDGNSADYASDKSRIEKSYKLLMDNYKNK